MKFWNKQREYRRTQWFTAPAPRCGTTLPKRWCQQNSSTGKFYFHYTNSRWWFEFREDAVAFALAWRGK